jgi:hypothetical protein
MALVCFSNFDSIRSLQEVAMGKDVDVNLDNIAIDIASDTDIDASIDANIQTNMNANIDSDSDIKIDTSNIRTELVLPQPFRTESKFAITEPIVSQNDIGLDIRPVVMDFCFKFEIGKLPPTCIRRPYQHHFGITLFGVEVLGFNFAGQSDIIIDEVQRKPHVAWGDEARGPARQGHAHEPHVEPGTVRIRLDR